MEKHGVVLKFKEGVTPEEAAAALERIRDVLDVPQTTTDMVPDPSRGARYVKFETRPFRFVNLIQSYNPEWGEPVWYVP